MTSSSSGHLTDHVAGFGRYMEIATRLLPVTRQRYCYEVRQFASLIGDPPLEAITPMVLLDWNGRFKDSATSTVVQKHSALRKFFTYLEQFEQLEHAGGLLKILQTQLQTPRDKGPVRPPYVLQEERGLRLLDAAGSKRSTGIRDRSMIHFLWSTGIRNSELTGLRLRAVDLLDRMATVAGKGDKERLVVFDRPCLEDLETWLEDRQTWPSSDYIFNSVNGTRLTNTAVGAVIRAAAKKAGLDQAVWPHVFRHTRITELLNNGMSIQDTAVMAGHTDIKTTMRYFHQEPGRLKEAYDKATGG